MPRLFDLLSEGSKKELIDENRKIKNTSRRHQPKPHHSRTPEKTGPIRIPDFVALDVETTGLNFKNDRIIEIGAIKFRQGKPSEEFSTFLSPGTAIPPAITDLTGITDADLTGAPDFSAVAEELLAFIGSDPLCGHQIEFDSSFLREELKRMGKPALNNALLDTALLSRILLDPAGRFSLKYVCGVLDVALDNAHRALHDAKASGEVAARLIPKLSELPLAVRQTIAACAPSSLFKQLIFQTHHHLRPEVLLNLPQEKSPSRLNSRETPEPVDKSRVATIFGSDGELATQLSGFSPRAPQQAMARGVADALNTQSLYIAEAGTGTGKSLAYLIPAALWALANNSRVIVSTRTRNLQDQLTANDLPIVKSATGKALLFSVLKGRHNYLCLHRFEQLLRGNVGNLSPRERFAILPLIVWANATTTGDIEEQNQFNPKWFSKIWNIISADHHECGHRRCPHYNACFLQKARSRALGSHIVIINHALFFSDFSSDTPFLGTAGPIIFDEAHHLESSGHRFLRVELDTSRINLFTEIINNLVQRTGTLQEEQQLYTIGKEIRTALKQLRKSSVSFLDALSGWARERGLPSPDYQIPCADASFASLQQTAEFLLSITELSDRLLLLKQAIKDHSEPQRFENLEAQVQACSEQTSQLKADLGYLTAAQTDEHVFWMEGNLTKGWVKLCGVPLDVGSLLAELWDRCDSAVIFTSATLSVASSFDYFKRTTGLMQHEARTASDQFKSPFGSHQTIAGALASIPAPDSPQFPEQVAAAIATLHATFSKNMLVLFTSNSMLSSVHQILREHPQVSRNNLLAQGINGSRQIIIEEFRKNDRMILLGTDSFWEGVDVPGDACEMVIIPRLPFPVPTHPLTQAIANRMQEREGESFFSYSVPEAVIRFRQGAGRLIRSTSDRGALIILDNRIVSRGYGKQFTRSIDVTFNTFESTDAMISSIKDFFENDPPNADDPPVAELRYEPLEDQ